MLRVPPVAAEAAQLRYVSGEARGIQRVRRGRKFVYLSPSGKRLSDPRQLRRIASLAIPPAWQNVWICPDAHGHLQATGYDKRGRKQYRYHPRWHAVRDAAKYENLLLFGECLPVLRGQLERDLEDSRLTKDKVVATVLTIMDHTSVRIGNDRYVEQNGSFGLTTLRVRHAKITEGRIEFQFRGKGGKPYRASVRDRRLAAIVRRCRDIPGQRLFQYIDGKGRPRPVTSTDVNDYIRRATGHPFTAKDFRTWAATVSALLALNECAPSRSPAHGRRTVAHAIGVVAEQLGNTRAICRKCYVHPTVIDAYESGRLHPTFGRCLAQARVRNGLEREECAVLAFFRELAAPELVAA